MEQKSHDDRDDRLRDLPDRGDVGRSKIETHEEKHLIAEHTQSDEKQTNQVLLVHRCFFQYQLCYHATWIPYTNDKKDQSREKLSIEGENDGRHAFQRLLSNTVADAEDDVNRNGRQVNHPKGRRF